MNNYEFTLQLNDLVSPKLKKIQTNIKKLNPFKKFNTDAKSAKKVVDNINKSFNALGKTTQHLNRQYDKNRQEILRLKRASLNATKERKKELNQELRLLRQENSEIREQIRLNKRNVKAGKRPIASMSMNSIGGALGKVGMIGGLIAGAGMAVNSVIQGANTQQQAEAQVQAGMQSTGNAAGFSFSQYKDMASNLQNKSLFGDEDILKNVTAQFQTFTNIAGQTFTDAQQTVLDISAKTGNGLKETSIQLGKALNDPIKGMTSLTRVGVQFTEQQKQQIKAYQDAGDLASAQGIILKELQTEFGGSAEAMAKAGLGPMKQLGMTLGDMGETIGSFLLPGINAIATALKKALNWLQPKTEAFFNKIKDLMGSIDMSPIKEKIKVAFNYIKGVIINLWGDIKEPVLSIFNTFKSYIGFIVKYFKNMFKRIKGVFTSNSDNIKERFQKIWNFIKVLFTTLSKAYKFIESLAKVIIVIVGKVFKFIAKLAMKIFKPVIDMAIWLYDSVLKPIFSWLGKMFDWLTKQLNWLLKQMGIANGAKERDTKDRKLREKPSEDDNVFATTDGFGGITDQGDNNTNLSKSDVNLSTDRSVKNYTFNIGNLIDELKIVTNELKESETEVMDIVTRMLRKAVLDIQQY